MRKALAQPRLIKTPEGEKEVIALKLLASDLTDGLKAVNSTQLRTVFGEAKSLSFGQMFK